LLSRKAEQPACRVDLRLVQLQVLVSDRHVHRIVFCEHRDVKRQFTAGRGTPGRRRSGRARVSDQRNAARASCAIFPLFSPTAATGDEADLGVWLLKTRVKRPSQADHEKQRPASKRL